jgi:NADP-dependent 3-hydroxy acid dehydrogenase YdfG
LQENAMKLDSSVSAIVTGGASGLGGATVKALRAQGVKVAIFDMNEKTGTAFAAETGAVYCNVNVTDDASVDAGFLAARAANGQERILVNCAGTGIAVKTAGRKKETGEISAHPLDGFNKIIQINLIGTFRCIAKSAAGMMTLDVMADGDRGAIVNTASVAAQDGQIGQAAYAASKGGVVGMTLPNRTRPLDRKHPRQHDPAGPLQHAAARRPTRQRQSSALGHGPQSETPWRPRRVRLARPADDPERLLQRRMRPSRRRHPHGPALEAAPNEIREPDRARELMIV